MKMFTCYNVKYCIIISENIRLKIGYKFNTIFKIYKYPAFNT